MTFFQTRIRPYLTIARPTHWFKNVFIAPGVLLVYFFDPASVPLGPVRHILIGFAATCLIASSNYVLNEILDAVRDQHHPEKHRRPAACGHINRRVAYAEWLLLAALGLWLAWTVQPLLGLACLALWLMGLLYNVPPVRLKDMAYADVLSESINNPIRLMVGWYATGVGSAPPLSVLLAYWMFGAFLMGAKRFGEYRMINDPERASRYRSSFAHYNERRLLESLFFYGALFGMMAGVFIARYRIELVLATPLVCFVMAYYLHVAFKPNSAVQHPERLWSERKLVLLLFLVFGCCATLLFVDVPLVQRMLHPWFTPQLVSGQATA